MAVFPKQVYLWEETPQSPECFSNFVAILYNVFNKIPLHIWVMGNVEGLILLLGEGKGGMPQGQDSSLLR